MTLFILALLACTSKDQDSGGADDTGGDGGDNDGGTDGGTASDPWAGHPHLDGARFYVSAHRGGALLWPEHTMLAYDNAMAAGSDVLELDVHATADGVMVLMHDDVVDRTTDGTGTIKDLTWAELSALDAGYWFTSDKGASYPYRGTGLTVPTMEEVLAAFPEALFNVELKQSDPSLVEPMLAMLEAYDAHDRVVMTSFEDQVLWDIREADPTMLTGFGALEGVDLFFWPEEDLDSYEPPTPYFAAPVEYAGLIMDTAMVAKANAAGVRIHAWTVNDADQMREVIDMGVQGIITDDPVTLRSIVDGG